jgi:hypothetical protein
VDQHYLSFQNGPELLKPTIFGRPSLSLSGEKIGTINALVCSDQ